MHRAENARLLMPFWSAPEACNRCRFSAAHTRDGAWLDLISATAVSSALLARTNSTSAFLLSALDPGNAIAHDLG